MELDGDELAHVPRAAQLPDGREQLVRLPVDAEGEAVEEDEVRAVLGRVDLCAHTCNAAFLID